MDPREMDELEFLGMESNFDDSLEAEFQSISPPSTREPEPQKPPEKSVLIIPPKPRTSNTHPQVNENGKKRLRSNPISDSPKPGPIDDANGDSVSKKSKNSEVDTEILGEKDSIIAPKYPPGDYELELMEFTFHDSFEPQFQSTSPPSPESAPHRPLKKPVLISQKPPNLKVNENGKERLQPIPIPDSPEPGPIDDTNGDSVSNRSEISESLSKEKSSEDEDWLRYSPLHVEMEVEVEVVPQETILSRFASQIEGDCIPVTGLDGDRVYAKICRADLDMGERTKKLSVRGDRNGLLQESVRVLTKRMGQEDYIKTLKASTDTPIEVVDQKETPITEQLWVEKYSPSSFTELLSDEQTNREVLMWLKQWDTCVYGSDIKSTTDDVLSALKLHSSISQHSKQSSSKSYFGNRRDRFSRDDGQRSHHEFDKGNVSQGSQETWEEKKRRTVGPPDQKILLLCGPPGLGKTTLAHVAAKHCGYRVVEINASDDRSASTLEAKIQDVIQMNSVIADSKPKCLVIDEIDGALGDGKGAVEIILKLVAADKRTVTGKENVANEEYSGRRSSRKKQISSSLMRPVICICNDLYAPALRPLRQVAKVHIFVQPIVSRIVNRLKYISNKEGVKTSSVALAALAECTECDIRSCLNTLQFLNKKKETLNMLEISSQVVGRKDSSKSAFDIWKEIFQRIKSKKARRSDSSVNSTSKGFDFLYSLISNRGDYDLIFDGIHENMLQLRYMDPMMQKTVKCLDNLLVSDITHRYVMRTQQMFLQAYQPVVAISIHGLISQHERSNIEWPKSSQRHRTVLAERMHIFQTWKNQISPYISRHLSIRSFVKDSISLMLHIMSPRTLRPVAVNLLSERERSEFSHLVDIMVSYAVTYKNIKTDLSGTFRSEEVSDASSLSLDPCLHEFIYYKDYSSCHFDLALAVKQVLVHEVEKQKILQASMKKAVYLQSKDDHSMRKNNTGNLLLSENPSGSAERRTGNTAITVHSGVPVFSTSSKAAPREIQKPVEKKKNLRSGFNFFERFIKVSKDGSKIDNNVVKKPVTAQRDSRPLLFKFNEGFTNAVKRPVRMREFLL